MTSRPAAPFDYTRRDYTTLRESLVTQVRARIPGWTGWDDPNDFVLALLECVAYVGDGLHYYLDRIANEAYVHTSVRPETVYSMARLVGYRPSRGSSATTLLQFTNHYETDVVIPAGTTVQSAGSGGWYEDPAEVVYFETVRDIVVHANNSEQVEAKEGLTRKGFDGEGEILGVSNGLAWQTFTIPQGPVSEGSVRVNIKYAAGWMEPWTAVEDIRAAQPGAAVFQLMTSVSGGPTRVMFGNGNTSGSIPPSGAAVKASYRLSGGSRGNVDAGTLTIITDAGYDNVEVTNLEKAQGGTDDEPVESVREKVIWRGPTTPERAVNLGDFARIALSCTGVGKSKAFVHTASEVKVAIAPLNDRTERPGMIDKADGSSELDPGFVQDVRARVERALRDAAFAGASTETVLVEYVPLYIHAKIHMNANFDPRFRPLLVDSLRRMFSYEMTGFGMSITPEDIQRSLLVQGVGKVEVSRLTRTKSAASESAAVHLKPWEIPYIPANIPGEGASGLLNFVELPGLDHSLNASVTFIAQSVHES